MADRRQTPNLMEQVQPGPVAATKPAHRQASKPAKQKSTTRASAPMRSVMQKVDSAEKPIKATYYLSPEAVQAVEDLYYQLRKQASPEKRTQISKSSIVEEAILKRKHHRE